MKTGGITPRRPSSSRPNLTTAPDGEGLYTPPRKRERERERADIISIVFKACDSIDQAILMLAAGVARRRKKWNKRHGHSDCFVE